MHRHATSHARKNLQNQTKPRSIIKGKTMKRSNLIFSFDYENDGLTFDTITHGPQITTGIRF
jgi:hypothetical protein